MRKNLTLLAIVFYLIFIASGAFAMVPRVKFPEWNKTDIKIADWNPAKGILTIKGLFPLHFLIMLREQKMDLVIHIINFSLSTSL